MKFIRITAERTREKYDLNIDHIESIDEHGRVRMISGFEVSCKETREAILSDITDREQTRWPT